MRFAQTRCSQPPTLSGTLSSSNLPNESNERFLDKVVGGVIITDRGKGKSLELRGMSVKGGLDDRAERRTAGATLEALTPRVITGASVFFDIRFIDVGAAEVFHGVGPSPLSTGRAGRTCVVRLAPDP